MSRPVVFATAAYAPLADEVCRRGGFSDGRLELHRFPDGERHLRILSPVSGRPAVLIAGTISDQDTLELFDVACGLVQEGAESLTLVIPYYGYSTMERASTKGEVVTAKTRARLLSAVPHARAANRVLLLEVHSEGLPYYFEGPVTAIHLPADAALLDAARARLGTDGVLASVDAGRAKRVQALANQLGVAAGFVFKRRIDASRTEHVALAADVRGKTVLLYDDMVRTGSSLISAATAYRDAGATRIMAMATHGLFPGNALAKLRDSGLFAELIVTDSHPQARALADGQFLSVVSVAGLLSEAILSLP